MSEKSFDRSLFFGGNESLQLEADQQSVFSCGRVRPLSQEGGGGLIIPGDSPRLPFRIRREHRMFCGVTSDSTRGDSGFDRNTKTELMQVTSAHPLRMTVYSSPIGRSAFTSLITTPRVQDYIGSPHSVFGARGMTCHLRLTVRDADFANYQLPALCKNSVIASPSKETSRCLLHHS